MDAKILHDLDLNYCHANGALFGTSRLGEVVENQDVYITCCGVPSAEFNTAFLKTPIRDLDACIRRAARYFGEQKLPYRITVRDGLIADCADGLRAAGYREVARMPGMCLRPIRDASKPHPQLCARLVETPEDLAHFQATAFAGFGLPPQAGPQFLTEEFWALPNVSLYLGTVEGRPACTSAVVTTDAVAGIYWVATLEARRGRGLGEAITWEAVKAGIAAGCELASLQASALGRPVYERMGFETPLHYVHFETDSAQ
ncbi:MAG: GNAT family N-acetyltransferase [Myxococcales bacterium]|nr:GNAT family N-acetyltransferase [Myxococcales bacterium]